MRASALIKTLVDVIPTRQNVYLWGPPGIGKSSIVNAAAKELKSSLIDVRSVLLDPVDLRGIPTVDTGTTKWCPPDFLPKRGKGILFFDELAQAAPAVQAALLQITLDRKLGEYVLPDGWSIVAASNGAKDKAGTHRVITPLLNRFLHLDLEVEKEDWQAWALKNDISPDIRGFINYRPNLLMSFNPSNNERSFPSPRSWEFVNRILKVAHDGNRLELIQGCIGQGPAAEFEGFLRTYGSLPDIDAMIRNPKKKDIPSQPDVLHAIVGAIADRAKGASDSIIDNIFQIAGFMPSEYAILLVRDVLMINKKWVTHPRCNQWMETHSDLLIASAS